MSAPWQCPACSAWIAPHIPEHRCDPPAGVVAALPYTGDPPGTTSATVTVPGTITVNVSGSAASERDLVRTIQKGLMKQASHNQAGYTWPLRSA
jgi:hypothetical protein